MKSKKSLVGVGTPANPKCFTSPRAFPRNASEYSIPWNFGRVILGNNAEGSSENFYNSLILRT